MTVVKAKYIKSRARAKANIRYIQHRSGKDGAKITRTLFGSDGVLSRHQAYRMIDEAEKGTVFYRIAISPSMDTEDIHRDLHLRALAEQTMMYLTEQFQQPIAYIATEHTEHAQHRHLHVLALLPRVLSTSELQALRETATHAALFQRQERDAGLAQQEHQREEVEQAWDW
jgi:hypothetical protein